MKTLLLSIVSLFVISCGQEIITNGRYDVSVSYTVDTWPDSLAGTTTEAQMDIYGDEKYEAKVVDGYRWMNGKEKDGKIIFATYKDYGTEDCHVYNNGYLEIVPDGEKFTGAFNSRTTFGRYGNGLCNVTDIVTVATLKGKLHKECVSSECAE
jgi:hypothetical protein